MMDGPNRRASYLATFLGFLGGYWLSGWSLRAKNKKTQQKYEKEIAVSQSFSFMPFGFGCE